MQLASIRIPGNRPRGDTNVGLLDFPARIDGDEVYLCWKLGEDRIRFYHRQDDKASPGA